LESIFALASILRSLGFKLRFGEQRTNSPHPCVTGREYTDSIPRMANGVKTSENGSRFPLTSWTMIVNTRNRDVNVARDALGELCRGYWTPVFAFIRSKGFDPDQSADHTQAFFTALLEKDCLADMEQSKGSFRSFLLVAVKHFLCNQLDAEKALKRGGGRPILPLEFDGADGLRRNEPEHSLTPEAVFEHQWATSLLDRTLKRLCDSYPQTDFDLMKPFLIGDAARGEGAAAAGQLGLSDGAFKVAIHRMRKRYRMALRAEIGETVADPSEVDGEIRYLMAILARRENQA
jgi:DNA-directed RNA polymerase specialized sigma24 family protein